MHPVDFEHIMGRKFSEIEQKYAPDKLYAVGAADSTPITRSTASVIGTRHPSTDGIDEARRVVKTLVENNICVISGLAAGVDTVAHRTAIDTGGNTIAVLGTPLNRTYPASNRALQDEIMRNHLAISQFHPEHPVKPGNFVMRNRTMALISGASIIIEAGEKSGTIHQGWEAIRLGRPLFVCGPAARKKPKWLESMKSYGAIILGDDDNYDDVLDAIPPNVEMINIFTHST